ncbi:hypothetical protein [Gordonibacter massiliensis (ex Traore et al. 2017)]|uniref:hypothetical protein n=1 Tax=Gordonibacter massiliensis (ex Traore et al. 2017) TaxID=1841863 RepID=UPI001C8B6140|nr:hypothetical protein [Gordonibacter massiliensis (ex Traore et al. 2017)]MBX9034077.1 hypothetical protein [Gordonibacter massiliensis (ex Traore et al. 2017)]
MILDFERTLPVVMGLGPSGLFLARQLSKLGCPVAAIARPADVGLHSNKITPRLLRIATDQDEVVSSLEALSGEARERKITILVSSDQYLTALLSLPGNRLLAYGLSAVDIENFELINDKSRLGGRLSKIASVPESYSVDSIDPNAFPCIVKWRQKHLDVKCEALPKVREIRSFSELKKLAGCLAREGFSVDDLIVQRLILGDNSFQCSYGGYYQDGKLLAGIAVDQVRQYPQGISAYVVESSNERGEAVKDAAVNLACSLDFSGFLEVEFKFDSNTGELFILDVNPRPWGWISVLNAKYPQFHRVFLGEEPESIPEKVAWRTLPRDLLANKNNMNARDVHSSEKTCLDIWDAKDMRPFFGLGLTAIKKAISL